MGLFFHLCAKCPLWLLHRVGAVLGWMVYWLSPTYRQRFAANAAQAGYSASQVRGAIAHAGRMVAELPRLWLGKPVHIEWRGQEVFEAAHSSGKGIIFLTPHLGCFEITAQAVALRYAPQDKLITVLYRPARQMWLQTVMSGARNRPGMKAVPASMSGVKALVKALRGGQALGMLPDQVPPLGLGVWADFFGQPAYTMTLSARLSQQTGAVIVKAWGERLPHGQGYRVHFSTFEASLSEDLHTAAGQINAAMEQLVRVCPEQYLWGYARYKKPRDEPMGTVQ